MYNNGYYNPLIAKDRIDYQIEQLRQMKEQLPQQQPTNLTQNFQLAPSGGMKYVNSIDDVKKEIVYTDTPYFSNDLSLVWVKNAKGNIKAYEMKEIVEKDEKDLIIESLQIQINDLRKEIKNAKSNNNDGNESIKDEESTNVSNAKSRKNKSYGDIKTNE